MRLTWVWWSLAASRPTGQGRRSQLKRSSRLGCQFARLKATAVTSRFSPGWLPRDGKRKRCCWPRSVGANCRRRTASHSLESCGLSTAVTFSCCSSSLAWSLLLEHTTERSSQWVRAQRSSPSKRAKLGLARPPLQAKWWTSPSTPRHRHFPSLSVTERHGIQRRSPPRCLPPKLMAIDVT